jgi:hypothetical protein
MAKVIFLYLLMLHLLGDYYFRFRFKTKTETKEDAINIKDMLIANLSYFLVFCIGSIFIWSIQIFLILLALSIIHFIIQLILFFVEKRKKTSDKTPEYIFIAIGQFVMIIIFIFTTLVLNNNSIFFILKPWVRSLLDLFSFHGREILKWGCILLFIHKPTNMLIKQLLNNFKPPQKAGEISNNAGAYIGTLERIIIALLLSANQFAAIGLVLTAKSIARYEKITTEKPFAEYYLLGTLLSTLVIIGIFLLINKLLY